MRALIIEDDPYIAEALKEALVSNHLIVETAPDGESGSFSAITNDYDLIILDTMLPKKGGKEVCLEIRKSGKTVPILSLSAKTDTDTKISLLDAGADDYLGKPFAMNEVIARTRALLRRPAPLSGDVLGIDTLEIDTRARTARRGNKQIHLTRKEFGLLEYLLRHRDSVVSRGMLMEHVWDMELDPFSNTVEAHMMSLRRKIERRGRPKLIHTVTGCGYKISLSA